MIRSILIITFAMVIFIPSVQAQESFESTTCVSGTMNVVYGSKELFISSMDLKGIVRSDSNSEILNNVSEWCVGLYTQKGEEIIQNGYCKYEYPNGDINTLEWSGKADGGNWNFIMGTGKWEGIKGGGTYNITQRAKSVAPDTFQNCRKIKGTFELPK